MLDVFGDESREARLRQFGRVQGRDSEYPGKRMRRMEEPRGELWM